MATMKEKINKPPPANLLESPGAQPPVRGSKRPVAPVKGIHRFDPMLTISKCPGDGNVKKGKSWNGEI
ncbi:hypothetical protein BOTNAR_0692g00030 [Botryotinia narcissicola]|uniref:Uncharacterized protein n=1 Tax=Botryotinia narcissicola TaxID=278944 RepID=A0A4Z1HJF6_9HELO|nr:hypothetical protein BOTNAR_0692g00030 [Botryotinia narcissicola]